MHDLHTHIEHERDEDIPRLEAKLPREESEKIAKSFARTKQFVPTKSHPGAPTANPLAEGLAGLLAAPIVSNFFESFISLFGQIRGFQSLEGVLRLQILPNLP
jgi:hypothetical protein